MLSMAAGNTPMHSKSPNEGHHAVPYNLREQANTTRSNTSGDSDSKNKTNFTDTDFTLFHHEINNPPKLRKTISRFSMLDNSSRLSTPNRSLPNSTEANKVDTLRGTRHPQGSSNSRETRLHSTLKRCTSSILEVSPGVIGKLDSDVPAYHHHTILNCEDICDSDICSSGSLTNSSRFARNCSVQTSPMMGGGLRYTEEVEGSNDFRPNASALLTPTIQRRRTPTENGASLGQLWPPQRSENECKKCCHQFYENNVHNDDVLPYPSRCRLRVVINVSGQIYETQLRTLQRFPETLLGHAEKRKPFYDPSRNQYFFDRSRTSFDAILQYYQSGGRLQRPRNVPVDVFADEIKFFQLGPGAMQMYQEDEGYVFEDQEFTECGATSEIIERKREKLPSNKLQRQIWLLFEKSDSSKAARVVAVVSITIIFLSIICFCLETVPALSKPYAPKNVNLTNTSLTSSNTTNTTTEQIHFTKNPFWIVETICISWFCIELIFRFLSSPEKKKFCFDCLNVIDLIAIIPYFVTTASLATAGNTTSSQKGISLAFIRVVRLVRVFRIFKLSRHSTGLQILGQTLRSSFRELGLLLFFVLIGVVLFSSAVYFAENQELGNINPAPNNNGKPTTYFKSIPDAFWWAIVTMTTVGYGDMHPVTVQGKVVGSVCAMSGILCLALPVPVIVSNFMYFYQRDVANKKRTFTN